MPAYVKSSYLPVAPVTPATNHSGSSSSAPNNSSGNSSANSQSTNKLNADIVQALRSDFEDWKKLHGQAGATVEEEEQQFANYVDSEIQIALNRQANPYASFSHNKTSGQSRQEFRSAHLAAKPIPPEEYRAANEATVARGNPTKTPFKPTQMMNGVCPERKLGGALPAEWDWRKCKSITPVLNQLQCGSCWAFSSSEVISNQNFFKTGKLEQFSPQQLVDCVQDANGCDGGTPGAAFSYIKEAGLDTLVEYPYSAATQSFKERCKASGKPKAIATVADFNTLPKDPAEIQRALYEVGALVGEINADSLRYYTGGVITGTQCNKGTVDHAIQLVGYGTDPKAGDYWLVKNSWGEQWGEGGYFRIKRGTDLCYVESNVTYAQL